MTMSKTTKKNEDDEIDEKTTIQSVKELSLAKRALQNKMNASKMRQGSVGKRAEQRRLKKAQVTTPQTESPTKTVSRVVKSGVSFRQYGELRGSGMPCRTRVVKKRQAATARGRSQWKCSSEQSIFITAATRCSV